MSIARRRMPLPVLLLVAAVPLLCWPDAVARATAGWSTVDGAQPWRLGPGWPIAWGLAPLVALSSMILWIAPGLLLTRRAVGQGRSATWLMRAAAVALVIGAVEVEVMRWLSPGGDVSRGLILLAMGVVAAIGLVQAAAWRAEPPPAPAPRVERLILVVAVVGLVAGVLLLWPKLVWESFNGDGAHAFEVSRRLLRSAWPFLPAAAGNVSHFPGVTSMLFTWPNAWMLGVLGPIDAAVRLPFVGYVVLIAAGLLALATAGRDEPRASVPVVLGFGLLPFVLAMAFSASYSPYHADLAMPGTQDALFMVTLLGFMHAMVGREWRWAAGWATLTHVGLPSGLVLIGFWLVAELLVMRPRPWRVGLALGAGLALLVLLGGLLPPLLARLGVPSPGGEYGAGRAIADLLRVAQPDWHRPLYVVIGAGILPIPALVAWNRQDDVARRITLVTVAYFLFFFVQSRIALHHFVPAMLLPLAVAARLTPDATVARRRYLLAWSAGIAVAVVLSWPAALRISMVERTVGRQIAQQVGSYANGDASVYAAADRLNPLLAYDWDPEVPERRYGGSGIAWMRYAADRDPEDSTVILLVPAPSGDSAVVVVPDTQALARIQAMRAPANGDAPVYRIPRDLLFGGRPALDLTRLWHRLRERMTGGAG